MIDPVEVMLKFHEGDEESSLKVVERYPPKADVDGVQELYSELLGDDAEATVGEDEKGRAVVEATASPDDLDAQVVAAHVAIGLARRALDREALEEASGRPRGYY